MATGPGAWYVGTYRYSPDNLVGQLGPNPTDQEQMIAYGVLAIKAEIVFLGFSRRGLAPNVTTYGSVIRDCVKDFQTARGLNATGEVDQVTARYLFSPRAQNYETSFNLPAGRLRQLMSLESRFDPAAIGKENDQDRGLLQFNLVESGVTVQEATNTPLIFSRATANILSVFSKLQDWDAAFAAHNVGPTGAGWYLRARNYVDALDVQGVV